MVVPGYRVVGELLRNELHVLERARREADGLGRYRATRVHGGERHAHFGDSGIYEETDPAFRRVAARLRADACFERASLFVWGFAPIFYWLFVEVSG
jgi:hypothetical protein